MKGLLSAEISEQVRHAFPLLARCDSQGRPLIYLDSAATALKPQVVVDAVAKVLIHHTANVHRSVHILGDEATELYENARKRVADFISADEHEIVVLRNTTEALNLVARCWPETASTAGRTASFSPKRILVNLSEHHSNLLPWGSGPGEKVTRLVPTSEGRLDLQTLEAELAVGDVGLVSVSHVSNVTGLANDVRQVAELAHHHRAIVVVDAAQSAAHRPLDVWDLDCDFLAFSSHKLGGPTGVGILFGRAEHLERLDWHLRGGSTVDSVSASSEQPKAPPWRFEAGTPPIEALVGLEAAIEFLEEVGRPAIEQHQQALAQHAFDLVSQSLPRAKVLGGADTSRCGPLSLVLPGVSPHLIARGLSDGYGIIARSGFHCAQPLHECLGLPASLRLSFALYNTPAEVETALSAISELVSLND